MTGLIDLNKKIVVGRRNVYIKGICELLSKSRNERFVEISVKEEDSSSVDVIPVGNKEGGLEILSRITGDLLRRKVEINATKTTNQYYSKMADFLLGKEITYEGFISVDNSSKYSFNSTFTDGIFPVIISSKIGELK